MRSGLDGFNAQGLTNIHQWQLCMMLETGTVRPQPHLLRHELRQQCRSAMQGAEVHPSLLQRSVAAVAGKLLSGFEEEVVEPLTGYSLDVALRSSRVAIEVDGPSHFVRDTGGDHLPNGPTLLKERLLRAADWRVVSVPFYEWDALGNSREAQRDYLRRRLADAGLHV